MRAPREGGKMSPSLSPLPVILILVALSLRAEALDGKAYDYGDLSISYDTLHSTISKDNDFDLNGAYTRSESMRSSQKLPSFVTEGSPKPLPLCCPEGKVYDQLKCILPPTGFHWKPRLDGALNAQLAYNGFPECPIKREYVQTYQREVHFKVEQAKVFLPYHVHLTSIERNDYCIAKVYDPSETKCEEFQTKIFTCFTKKEPGIVMWVSVAFSHLFLFLTLLSFFFVSELRCLQGQYIICFLISLLIYNICLLPASVLPMEIGDVSCIALGAVKYFFFCGTFLWFNALCFDLWRTLRNKQDISGRRRFLMYSVYSWTLGAILTTVVLVMPYMKDDVDENSRNDPLKDNNYESCKLKLEMNMILQIAQLFSLILDLIFLIMASCYICSYPKFGNGLPRCEATLCLKQGWKLFVIMVAHMLSCIDSDMLQLPVEFWFFVLLESAAVFGVFAYRRTILRKIFAAKICRSYCLSKRECGSMQEKGHLTVA